MKSQSLGEARAFSAAEEARIKQADRFALTHHRGQKRKSGQPYISHPRAVAQYLRTQGADADTIIAGLLHDTVEDTGATIQEVEQIFGADVAMLVDGVTKLGQVDYAPSQGVSHTRHAASVENIRKLLLAMSKDLRVLMIKLADRRHNLITLKYLKPEDRQRIAQESLEVFAPLADRLGMGALKAEIEDLAFQYASPDAYQVVNRLVADNLQQSKGYVEELSGEVTELLRHSHVRMVSIHGRQKHLYSIYRKLTKAQGDISKIYDLVALRIIVPSVSDCYQTLGIIHQAYKPLIYRIKDYIAVPKPNGYRSLHTTVFARGGRIIEIQIRTPEMHQEAEQGLAAHTLYSVHKDSAQYQADTRTSLSAKRARKLSWIQDLAGLTAQNEAGNDLMDRLKVDLFRDRIFVFSPKGDLYDLPEGATPVDFAFAIHSDVGLRTQGAKVNGKISPLDRPLGNRDMVEIITRRQPGPNRQWLNFVKTTTARSRIKSWFRNESREANISSGRQLLEQELAGWGYKKMDDVGQSAISHTLDQLNLKELDGLLAAIGEGSISTVAVRRRLVPESRPHKQRPTTRSSSGITTGRAQVVGAPELPCVLATCCQPAPPAKIVGYITRGSGITVHVASCNNIPSEPDRVLDCRWETINNDVTSPAHTLLLRCHNRVGLVHDITGVVSAHRFNIVKIATEDKPGDPTQAVLNLKIEESRDYMMSDLTRELEQRSDVIEVKVLPARRSMRQALVDRINRTQK